MFFFPIVLWMLVFVTKNPPSVQSVPSVSSSVQSYTMSDQSNSPSASGKELVLFHVHLVVK